MDITKNKYLYYISFCRLIVYEKRNYLMLDVWIIFFLNVIIPNIFTLFKILNNFINWVGIWLICESTHLDILIFVQITCHYSIKIILEEFLLLFMNFPITFLISN